MSRGNRSANRYKDGAPRTYWRGTIGREARAELTELAHHIAFERRISQQAAEEALIAVLIHQEYARPQPERPAVNVALALLAGRGDDDDKPIML